MTLGEKLKTIRKAAGLSQEQLAEQLKVSRQAVTKWEGDSGIPDLDNLLAIASYFAISLDDLLSRTPVESRSDDLAFESVTEYDIDGRKRFDLKFGGAKGLVVSGCDGEKLRVRLASDTLSTLQQDFKVKIDDIKKRIDVDVHRKNGVTEGTAKENVVIFVELPVSCLTRAECQVHAEQVTVRSLVCEQLELDIKTRKLLLEDVVGEVEIDCNLDMEITCNRLPTALSVNQVSASSKLYLPENAVFTAVAKGIGTRLSFARDGQRADRFDTPDAPCTVELNGLRSDLVICAQSGTASEKEDCVPGEPMKS